MTASLFVLWSRFLLVQAATRVKYGPPTEDEFILAGHL